MEINVIKINGVDYAPVGSQSVQHKLPDGTEYEFAIIIADRGHVWVGKTVSGDGVMNVYEARIIRHWGTTQGLNELIYGPLESTVLDAEAPLVKINNRAIIAIIPADEEAWKSKRNK